MTAESKKIEILFCNPDDRFLFLETIQVISSPIEKACYECSYYDYHPFTFHAWCKKRFSSLVHENHLTHVIMTATTEALYFESNFLFGLTRGLFDNPINYWNKNKLSGSSSKALVHNKHIQGPKFIVKGIWLGQKIALCPFSCCKRFSTVLFLTIGGLVFYGWGR